MLKIYLISVVIWMIIIYAMAAICEASIKTNGWTKDKESKKRGVISSLFILSAVPVFRIIVVISMFIMAAYTPEQVEEMKRRGD